MRAVQLPYHVVNATVFLKKTPFTVDEMTVDPVPAADHEIKNVTTDFFTLHSRPRFCKLPTSSLSQAIQTRVTSIYEQSHFRRWRTASSSTSNDKPIIASSRVHVFPRAPQTQHGHARDRQWQQRSSSTRRPNSSTRRTRRTTMTM